MKRILALILVALLLLCGCAHGEPAPTTASGEPETPQTTAPEADTTLPSQTEPLPEPEARWEELPCPQGLFDVDREENPRGNVQILYSDAERLLLAEYSYKYSQEDVDAGRVGDGYLYYTDAFRLWDLEGGVTAFPVSSDAQIVSALPWEDGVIYVEYGPWSEDAGVTWSVLQTDGTASEVLDTGTAESCYEIPVLFFSDAIPHYLCKTPNGTAVRRIRDGKAELLLEAEGCYLFNQRGVAVESNGTQYCFGTGTTPDTPEDLLLICDSEGIVYEYTLRGKLMSWAVTDKYAVCFTYDEDDCYYIEAVDLATREEKRFPVPLGSAFDWNRMKGSGTACVLWAGAMNYRFFYVDIDAEQLTELPSLSGAAYLDFMGSGQFCHQRNAGGTPLYRITVTS